MQTSTQNTPLKNLRFLNLSSDQKFLLSFNYFNGRKSSAVMDNLKFVFNNTELQKVTTGNLIKEVTDIKPIEPGDKWKAQLSHTRARTILELDLFTLSGKKFNDVEDTELNMFRSMELIDVAIDALTDMKNEYEKEIDFRDAMTVYQIRNPKEEIKENTGIETLFKEEKKTETVLSDEEKIKIKYKSEIEKYTNEGYRTCLGKSRYLDSDEQFYAIIFHKEGSEDKIIMVGNAAQIEL